MKYNYSILRRLKIHYLKYFGKEEVYHTFLKSLMYHDLNKYGPRILEIFNELTSKRKIDYWLTWGSLLGYYREHGFINGDNDLDIGMFYSDITLDFINELISRGFKFDDSIVDKDYRGYHVTFNYCNVKVDIYSFKMNNAGSRFEGYTPDAANGNWKEAISNNRYLTKRVDFPYNGIRDVDFLGVRTKVPNCEIELLKILYGESFMTPIPGYKSKPNEHIVIDDINRFYSQSYNYDSFVDLKKKGLI